MNYGFIGLGNMATAIIKGMAASKKFDTNHLYGMNRSYEKTDELVQQYGIQGCTTIEELMKKVDVVVLAVKPQVLSSILPTVKAFLRKNQIVISIAAGKSLAYLQEQLDGHPSIFRVMPNINAIIGASTSCYSTPASTSNAHKQLIEEMFETIGTIVELPENLFSIFTTIGCASPAFTYLYIDSLARAAVREGMPKEMALEIAASSVLGSAKMILESKEHPMALVDQVCSPGGTTIQGVTSLQANRFEGVIHDAVMAVTRKDHSLQ
ncbi:pyrroline-5-carboxylate reductase [Lysinibacillus odysseyi]|uniref:Pyrroline-5-carboxylate reductase n=1 Tax=Lysinibacillus odysseyi 34hs-1 = NBRC 100172 TaxID=1220589 RepID=A0A0A3IF52_9BACI|nr:pyrroline-5-carboxylate reductase [Lysinibacillus odysseyi]KGR83391.1 pyrroline-5-carboxylate reductase [Lysinibacillus odysseyi 34hs-1 = NBRC 100172]